MEKGQIKNYLNTTLRELKINNNYQIINGKVRDIIDFKDKLLICTTDRISAFDRVLSTIPCKGEVLNLISLFWFKKTNSIIKNHIIEQVSPRSVLVKKCQVVPLEVVVRGYLTGSAWRDYEKGKPVSGIRLKSGMRFNQKFEKPLITPSTKSERGTHDLPISAREIIHKKIVPAQVWKQIEIMAIKLFNKGTEVAAKQGLILVDTKYEFGLLDGQLYIIDEIHTPDSSRYWYADTYEDLFARGEKQRKLDKEYFRQWLMELGYMGDGQPPAIPDQVRLEVAWRYIKAYETITGIKFSPSGITEEDEIQLIEKKISNI